MAKFYPAIVASKSIEAYLKVRKLPKFEFKNLLNGIRIERSRGETSRISRSSF